MKPIKEMTTEELRDLRSSLKGDSDLLHKVNVELSRRKVTRTGICVVCMLEANVTLPAMYVGLCTKCGRQTRIAKEQ